MDKISFEDWCKEVKEIALPYYGEMDPESWKDFYDNDYTPKEALDEDLSYG